MKMALGWTTSMLVVGIPAASKISIIAGPAPACQLIDDEVGGLLGELLGARHGLGGVNAVSQ